MRYRLSVEEIVEDYTALITEMSALNPDLKWLLLSEPDPSYTRRDARQPVKQIDSAARHRPIATTVPGASVLFPLL